MPALDSSRKSSELGCSHESPNPLCRKCMFPLGPPNEAFPLYHSTGKTVHGFDPALASTWRTADFSRGVRIYLRNSLVSAQGRKSPLEVLCCDSYFDEHPTSSRSVCGMVDCAELSWPVFCVSGNRPEQDRGGIYLRKFRVSRWTDADHTDMPCWVDRACLHAAMSLLNPLCRRAYDTRVSLLKHLDFTRRNSVIPRLVWTDAKRRTGEFEL